MLHARTSRIAQRGFTLVELLVSISIIVLLIGILFVAFSGILNAARSTANLAAVNSIGQGVETFRSDFNSKPPPLIIERSRGGGTGPTGSGNRAIVIPEMFDTSTERADAIRNARYYSEWTLAAYLIGDSDLNGDGITTYSQPGNEQPNLDDGHDGPGFRDPGEILAWKRRSRTAGGGAWVHEPAQTGRVYGPYLEPGFEDFTEAVNEGNSTMLRFVDSYRNPIRYYRDFITRDQDKGEASSAFMPQELQTFAAAEKIIQEVGAGNPQYQFRLPFGTPGQELHALSREVLNAEYVILAANDDPTKYVAGDGSYIAPYGDEAIEQDGTRVRLDLIGTVQNPGPFVPSVLDADDKLSAGKTWLEMIDSNLRFTP